MKNGIADNFKEDPSDIKQSFADINIQLHCCRYWMLSEWECTNMAFPFWRLYHNSISGASVYYKDICTNLITDKIIIIPPNTSFSTSLACRPEDSAKERIAGKRISSLAEIEELADKHMVDHLFIHFNLGLSYDSIHPGVYEFPVTGFTSSMLQEIKNNSINNSVNYNFHAGLPVQILILYLLKQIPDDKWKSRNMDKRVIKAYDFIENNINQKLSNKALAEKANMAVNSFARLFKENAGVTIQQYAQKKKIDKSLVLLHHSNKSIDEIANECGFIDRHHFSKVFKQVMKMPPVFYRQRLTF